MTTRGRGLLPVVPVGPFGVADAATEEVLEALTELAVQEASGSRVAFALHVGGLNRRRLRTFVESLADGDVVYADGASIVLLARAAGAQRIERSPTTDLGVAVIESVAARLGRRARIAMIGGPDGLAESAGQALSRSVPAEIVFACDGYAESWDSRLAALRLSTPDIIFVGLGMPLEALWVTSQRALLPSALVMTCGGWFGFLSGGERRAPGMVQRSNLEWTWRLAQSPSGLLPRYIKGLVSTFVLLPGQWRQRKARAQPS